MEQLVYDEPCELCGQPAPHRTIVENARGTPHNMVECAHCGLRFFNPRPDVESRIEGFRLAGDSALWYFAETGKWPGEGMVLTPDQQWEHLHAFAASVYRRAVGFAHMTKAPLVYEVGAWVGWLLEEFLGLGADDRSSGCDANPFSGAVAWEAFAVTVEPRVFQAASPPWPGKYDLVVMNDVIEHSQTPSADLRKARDISRYGTVLCLKTFIDDLDEPRGRPMMHPPDHAYHFTRETLRRAVEQAKWNIVAWEEEEAWSQVRLYALAG